MIGSDNKPAFDTDCVFNKNVQCTRYAIRSGRCHMCGWNPAVIVIRKAEGRRAGMRQTIFEIAEKLRALRSEYEAHKDDFTRRQVLSDRKREERKVKSEERKEKGTAR